MGMSRPAARRPPSQFLAAAGACAEHDRQEPERPDEHHRPPPRARPPPAAQPAAELPRGGDQEVRRRPGRPARRADRLLRLRLAVPAAARARDGARLRAAGRPRRAAADPRRHARAVPDHPRPAQTALAHRQRRRAGDRRDRLAARGHGHHRRHAERVQPHLERAVQAPSQLPALAAARPRHARDARHALDRLHGRPAASSAPRATARWPSSRAWWSRSSSTSRCS